MPRLFERNSLRGLGVLPFMWKGTQVTLIRLKRWMKTVEHTQIKRAGRSAYCYVPEVLTVFTVTVFLKGLSPLFQIVVSTFALNPKWITSVYATPINQRRKMVLHLLPKILRPKLSASSRSRDAWALPTKRVLELEQVARKPKRQKITRAIV